MIGAVCAPPSPLCGSPPRTAAHCGSEGERQNPYPLALLNSEKGYLIVPFRPLGKKAPLEEPPP